jgi:hypothetical protein
MHAFQKKEAVKNNLSVRLGVSQWSGATPSLTAYSLNGSLAALAAAIRARPASVCIASDTASADPRLSQSALQR